MGMICALSLSSCTLRPTPLTDDELLAKASADLSSLLAANEPVTGPITLQEAAARALKYNMDARIAVLDEAVTRGELTVAYASLLPTVQFTANSTSRDNTPGFASDTPSDQDGTDRTRNTTNLTTTYSILDFGLSYAFARQQADRVLIARERRRSIANSLINDVRAAFWRAVNANELLPQIDALIDDAGEAFENSEQLRELNLQDPVAALSYGEPGVPCGGTFDKTLAGADAVVYRGRLELGNLSLRQVPENFRLIPGMGVTADIKVGRRRMITYLVYPIIRGMSEAFREP